MKKVICNDERALSPSLKEGIYEKINQHSGEGVDMYVIFVSPSGKFVYLEQRRYTPAMESSCLHTWKIKWEDGFYIGDD